MMMGPKRKRKLPDGTFRIAGRNRKPQFADPKRVHAEASAAFYAALIASTQQLSKGKDVVGLDMMRQYTSNALRNYRVVPEGCDMSAGHGFDASYHVGTERQIAAFTKLFHAVQKAIEAAYQRGLDDGRQLLAQLAAGQITVDQLNKASVGELEDQS